MKLSIGPAGLPENSVSGLDTIAQKGCSAAEIPFTYSVWMKEDLAREIGKRAADLGIRLSIHGSYYINLAALESEKREASKKRILSACRIAHILGASPVVFHAGFYLKRDPETVYSLIKKELMELLDCIKKEGLAVSLALETTGKPTQFGSLEELLRLRGETGCSLCVDFAHLEARESKPVDYGPIIERLSGIPELHCHFSGIVYGPKGEKHHIPTPEAKVKELFEAFQNAHQKHCTVINESPQPLQDAQMMISLWTENSTKED